MRRKVLAWVMTFAMLLSLIPAMGLTALAAATASDVPYIDRDGKSAICASATVVESSENSVEWNAGWYVVNGNITINNTVNVNGYVELILADGAKLTVNGKDGNAGISVDSSSDTLTIYGQTNQTGELIATGGEQGEGPESLGGAGIGGDNGDYSSSVAIYGGSVTAIGSNQGGAGIGAGKGSSTHGHLYVYDATVKAGDENNLKKITTNTKPGETNLQDDKTNFAGKKIVKVLAPVKYQTPVIEKNVVTGWKTETCKDYTVVTKDTTTWAKDGWYVVKGKVNIVSSVVVNQNVNLILTDGADLDVRFTDSPKAAINVTTGKSLTIYGQTNQTGKLTAIGAGQSAAEEKDKKAAAGIGGNHGENAGSITINGGVITARGHQSGNMVSAAIGGGNGGNGGTVTINGGTVTARGGAIGASGIGAGKSGTDAGKLYVQDGDLIVCADNSFEPTKVVKNIPVGTNLQDIETGDVLKGMQYVTVKPPHLHSFDLSTTNSENDTVTLKSDCSCNYAGTDKSLTIVAPSDLTYNGSKKAATLKNGENTAGTFLGEALPTITYKSTDGKGYDSNDAPTAAGKYKASITVGKNNNAKTASVEFEITKKELTVSGTTVANKNYDGTTDATVTYGTLETEGKLIGTDEVKIASCTGTFGQQWPSLGTPVTVSYTLDNSNYYVKDETKEANITLSLVVSTLGDVVNPTDNVISLREAITYANDVWEEYNKWGWGSPSGGDKITFAPALNGTITLKGNLPEIKYAYDIIGDNRITIDGNNTYTIFNIAGTLGSMVGTAYEPVIISGLTITGGIGNNGNGGAISTEYSYAKVENCIITENRVTGNGGAIYAGTSTNLTVVNSTIAGNTATGNGGGIASVSESNAFLTLINNTIVGNTAATGPAVYAYGTALDRTAYNNLIVSNGADTQNPENQVYLFAASESDGNYLSMTPSAVFQNALPTGSYQNWIPALVGTNTNVVNAGVENDTVKAAFGAENDWSGIQDNYGNDRVLDGQIDIGSYEYVKTTPAPTPTSTSGGGNAAYKVSLADADKGYLSTDKEYANKGQTVTIFVSYSVTGINVKDSRNNSVAVTDVDGDTFTFTMPASNVTVSIASRNRDTSTGLPYTDVYADDWFYPSVTYVYEKGIMKGISDSEFGPYVNTSRAMVATILWRMAGSPVVNYAMPFTDVPDDAWYTEAVRWAASTGIVKGVTDTLFAPNDLVTREALATMIYRYEQTLGNGFVGSWVFLLPQKDRASVSDWADEAMHWCVMMGIINGDDQNFLNPQKFATRAEVATIFMNLDKLAQAENNQVDENQAAK